MLIFGLDVMMLHLPLFYFFGKANAAFGINLCKVYINDDPKMTLTYIMKNVKCGYLCVGVGIAECLK